MNLLPDLILAIVFLSCVLGMGYWLAFIPALKIKKQYEKARLKDIMQRERILTHLKESAKNIYIECNNPMLTKEDVQKLMKKLFYELDTEELIERATKNIK